MALIVELGRQGRLTLPAAIRKALALGEGSHLEVEVQDGVVRLRPIVAVPREDAWAYTLEHQALLTKAVADVAAGRISANVSPEDLLRLAAVDAAVLAEDDDQDATPA